MFDAPSLFLVEPTVFEAQAHDSMDFHGFLKIFSTSSNIFQHSSRFFLFTCCASAMPGSSSEVADPESPEVDDHLDGSSNKAQQGSIAWCSGNQSCEVKNATANTWVRFKIQGMDQGPEPTHDPYPPIHTLIHTLWYCMIHTLDPYP